MVANARNTYLEASVSTASPARLLVMLCDRLVLDVNRAHEALAAGNTGEVHRHLIHAQDIVTELASSLNPEAFTGGQELLALYLWLHENLVKANVSKDRALVEHCAGLAASIAETWREAALAVAQGV